jgi:GT2 family glycosyltransferase
MSRKNRKKMLISIVIPTINKEDTLIKCIDSIKAANKINNVEVIIVDDHSLNQSYALLRKKHPDIKLILHDQNEGFGASCNDGIREAKGDIIILLNDDTIVAENWLSEIIKPLTDKRCGISTCKILFMEKKNGKDVIWYAGGFFSPFLPRISWHRGYRERDLGQYNKGEKVSFASGCVMAFRKDFIDKVGLFDEKFFLYFEDVDICVRTLRAGYYIYYNPNTVVWHAESMSTKRESTFWLYCREKSRFIFVKKNFICLLPLFILYFLVFYFPQSVWFSIKNKNIELISSSLLGFIHGLCE